MCKQLMNIALLALLGSVVLPGCAEDEGDSADDNNEATTNNTATNNTADTDRCAQVVCDQAPMARCKDAMILETFEENGVCAPETGLCSYTAMDVDCTATSQLCMDNACVVDPASGFPDFENATTVPGCDEAQADARCAQELDAFTAWGPASVISSLAILTGDGAVFDFTGDGVPDNSLGNALSFAGAAFNPNPPIQEAIEDGSTALVLEHGELTSTEVGTTFRVGFLLAEPTFEPPNPVDAGGNAYLIERASFESGAFPQAVMRAEILADGLVRGGPGDITLSLNILGISLNVKLSAAVFSATIGANSNLSDGTGVQLEGGNLAGAVRVEDLFDAINAFSVQNCGCVTNSGPGGELVSYNVDNPALSACLPNLDAAGCSAQDDTEAVCQTIATTACTFLGLIPGFADVDTEDLGSGTCFNDRSCDALSVALTFEAVGAKIDGVQPAAD
ncbi:MAG: hypothetical protein AAGI01_02450 [Myxococcota bacterium]